MKTVISGSAVRWLATGRSDISAAAPRRGMASASVITRMLAMDENGCDSSRRRVTPSA